MLSAAQVTTLCAPGAAGGVGGPPVFNAAGVQMGGGRATAVFGRPEETVDPRKQRRVIAAARDYLAQRRGPAKAARFDVIAVLDGPQGPALTHFENAFDA